MTAIDVSLKKSYPATSDEGLTFYWLRCVFGELFENAIASAVRLVYFPQVLAASSKPWDKVAAEVERCRVVFERKTLVVEQPLVIEKPKSKRIYLSFRQSFEAASYEGMTFEWLLHQYKDQIFEAIASAVQLVYLPSALASYSDKQELAVAASKLARYQFEQMMDDAILNAETKDTSLYLLPLAQLPTGETLGDVSAPASLEEEVAIVTHSESGTASVPPLDDFDDDFVNPFTDDDD
jgi:hypothetical protein